MTEDRKMNRALTTFISLSVISASALFVGCNWSSGGDSAFNSSRANLDVNVSGTYRGNNNGKAVSNPSAGNISQLVVQQSGNVLEVVDSQGSTYRGNVGIPLTLGDADNVIPLGAELASYTVAWEGNDNVANKRVRFTGNIELVAVEDISGDAITETRTVGSDDSATTSSTAANNTSTTSTDQTTTTSQNVNSSQQTGNDSVNNDTQNDTTTETGQGGTQTGNNGQSETQLTSTTITTTRNNIFESANTFDNSSNTTVDGSQDTTTTTTNSSGDDRTDTTTTTDVRTEEVVTRNDFVITGNNVQMRLRGSWIEDAGNISNVDAVSAGSGGILSIPIGGGDGDGIGGN